MNRIELIALVVSMNDDDRRLEKIEKMLLGQPEQEREPLMSLGDISKKVKLSYSQLFRLGVPKHASDRTYGGRPRYRLSEVEAYLRSPDCQAIREGIRRDRETCARKKAG